MPKFDVGLPPDLVRHDEPVLLNTESPWGIPKSVFEPLWEKVTGVGVTVSIIDTGHQDHRLLPDPVDYLNMTNESDRLLNDHGIHCSGTVLGRDGIGIAPGANYLPIKVLAGRGGSGSSDWIARGIRAAVDAGASILSLSLGGPSPYTPTRDALAYAYSKGCVVIAAAGNAGFNGQRNTIGYPAKFGTNVISVGATRGPYGDQTIASFSSGGSQQDIAAPGERVLSCTFNDGLQYLSGTSMATPYVAGLHALLTETIRLCGLPRPQGYEAWKQMFIDTAEDKGRPGHDPTFGHGIVFADTMVESLLRLLDRFNV